MHTTRFRSGTQRTRRTTTAVAGVAAAALFLVACGGDDDAADPTPPATAAGATSPGTGSDTTAGTAPEAPGAPAGTLVVGLDRDPGHMDPHHVDSAQARSISQAMFDTLVMNYDGEFVPNLADFEVVDDLTVNFTLREGITFHDGTALDAADVVASFERITDPEVNSHYLPQFEAFDAFEAVDDQNLVLHLNMPFAGVLDRLTNMFILPSEKIADGTDFETAPVGTGPFTFVSYAPDDKTVLAANPDAWEGGPKGVPAVGTVEFRAIPEEATRVAELNAGNVDLAFKLTPDNIGTVEASGNSVITYNDLSVQFLQINTASLGEIAAADPDNPGWAALADPNVRTALNLAIDREAIIDSYFGGMASPLGQPWGPGSPITPTDEMLFEYDPERAKALLAEAGYGDGLELDMMVTTSVPSDLTSLVTSYLAEIGVNVTIESIESATFNDGWTAAQFPQLRMVQWSTPEQVLDLLLGTGQLISSYTNPDVDALLEEQAVQVDPAARRETITELARVLHDDAAFVYLWSNESIIGIDPAVTGFTPHPAFIPVAGVSVG